MKFIQNKKKHSSADNIRKRYNYFRHGVSLQTTDSFSYQSLVNGYYFPELYGRWQRQAALFLLHSIEPVFKLFPTASVRAYGDNNGVGTLAIKLISGNHQSRSLLVGGKVGEGKGYQNNITKFATLCHRLRRQGCSKNQTMTRQVLSSRSQQDQYAGGAVNAPKIAVAFQPALLKWLFQLLLDFEIFVYSLLLMIQERLTMSMARQNRPVFTLSIL